MADETWTPLRERIIALGSGPTEVVLPGDQGIPFEGALVVAPRDGDWTLATVDYGQTRVLFAAEDEAGIGEILLDYLGDPLPAPVALRPDEREQLLSTAAPHLLDLAGRAQNGLLIDVPPGILFNRIGALDGFLLYPAETSFEARSLPPTALQAPLHEFRTAATIRMNVRPTPPWFGRPGGGLRFAVEDTTIAIRDLVLSGALERITA